MFGTGASIALSTIPPPPAIAPPKPRALACIHASASEGGSYASPAPAQTPLLDAVAARGRCTHEAPFHVPGHKRGAGTPPALHLLLGDALRYDLTELEGLDYLSSPEGPIAQAQALAAATWGADHTWFLVNGTTVGIHAAVLATCFSPGDALIVARNAHLSAFNAMALAGCTPEYVAPVQHLGLAHQVEAAALEAAFVRAADKGLHPRAALVVSPTYFGIMSDVGALTEVCTRHGAALIVDEAHGAHLNFISVLPGVQQAAGGAVVSALQAGADIAVQSTHKQLAAMTQGAMLHVCSNKVDRSRVDRALQVLQTSSPSYLVMASLDAARAQAQDPAAVAPAHLAALHINEFFEARAPSAAAPDYHSAAPDVHLLATHWLAGSSSSGCCPAVCRDPWRFTVFVHQLGCTGWEAASQLESQWGVVAELSTHNAVVFAAGIGTTMQHAQQLTRALDEFVTLRRLHAQAFGSSQPPLLATEAASTASLPIQAVLTPREALASATEVVPIEAAVGRVCAELLCPYPPGVPTLCPGERVTAAAVAQLQAVVKAGGKVVGAADPGLGSLRVVTTGE